MADHRGGGSEHCWKIRIVGRGIDFFHAVHDVVPDDVFGGDIVVPGADAAGVGGELEVLFVEAQALLALAFPR